MIEAEYIALARAVIIQAARDAAAGDLTATAWLASEETADTWYTVAGVRRSTVLAWLMRGSKIRAKIKKPSKSKAPTKRKQIETIPAMG